MSNVDIFAFFAGISFQLGILLFSVLISCFVVYGQNGMITQLGLLRIKIYLFVIFVCASFFISWLWINGRIKL